MRAAGLALALLLLLVPFPGSAAEPATYRIAPPGTAGALTTMTVNLVAPTQSAIEFEFDPTAFAADEYNPDLVGLVQGVIVKLTKGADEIQVQLASPAAQGVSGNTWRGILPTSHRDLTKGDHVISVVLATGDGSHALADDVVRKVVATTTPNDVAKPTITLSSNTSDAKVRLGFGDSLAIFIDDVSPTSGIRRVTYRLPGFPGSLPLDFPYVLDFDTFSDGPQVMTINATDRAGNFATKNVTVIADAKAPDAVVTLPDRLFVGVPATVTVAASDVNPYNVTFKVGNLTLSSPGAGPNREHSFPLLVNETGLVTLTVGVFDIVGNSAEKSYALQATVLETDSSVRELSLSTPFPIVGEALSLKVVLQQDPGFVPLDLNVTLRGAISTARNATVATAAPSTLLIPLKLGVGGHSVVANVSAPANVKEMNTTNQERTLDFEVFFAKVTDSNRTYYIRAGPFGLPVEALRTDGKVMPLTLVEQGRSIAYQFVDGDRTVTWDPNPVESTSTASTSETGKAKGSPPVATPLVLVALMALALRRRT